MEINTQMQVIGDILVDKGFLSAGQLEEFCKNINADSFRTQEEFENLLITGNLVSEDNLLTAYSSHLNIPYIELNSVTIDPKTVSLIPAKFANANRLIAIKKEDNVLTVALRNPFNVHVIDEVKVLTRLNVKAVISKSEDILNAIKLHYGLGAETVEVLVKDAESRTQGPADREVTEDLEKLAKDASIVKYVNQMLIEAYEKRATDIHIEPFAHRLRIRYRIDGILHEVKTPDIKKLQLAIISRFKVMANLNIAEKRRSQDGRCKVVIKGEEVDLRLSTFPTLFGEGLSIRLLSRKTILLDNKRQGAFLGIDQLGFSDKALQRLKSSIGKSNGMILVTGPTGCGKTTTLYACLNYLNDAKVNIVTLEDPIEYQLDGLNQIQINPKADMTFANGLRSILRQDPDIIMVGEIRDLETAQIAVRSALTGHLLFSTLHTNSAVDTIIRLLDLGIEPYLVTATVRAVVAQRLVRIICGSCKIKYVPDKNLLDSAGITQNDGSYGELFKGEGCRECGSTGYKGRTGIYEMLVMDDALNSLIIAGAPWLDIEKKARDNGMATLKQDGLDKAKKGITTIEEVIRVTEQD